MRLVICSLTIVLLSLTGCKVGPDYEVPFTEMPTAFAEDRPGLTYAPTDEELLQWWTRFNDPLLNDLLERTICGSFDYHIALARVTQAREQYHVKFAEILPDFVMDALGTRYRISRSFRSSVSPINPSFGLFSPVQNFFQVGLDAIWEIDFFGKLRRAADSSYDLWMARVEDARTAKIVVLSEVAVTYITIRALQKKIEIQSQFIALNQDLAQLATSKLNSGLSNEIEVLGYVASTASYEATLKLLETELKQNIYSLGVLVGENPEDLLCDFQTIAPIPYSLDMIVPAGIPCDLLRRRPDIASAERQLASATELIGVAVAELFPTVSLAGSSSSFASNPLQGANVGYTSDELSKLFKADSRIWGIGGFLTWPVFDFGKRAAGVRLQKAVMQQNYLNYQKTIVTALGETESALIAYFNEQERLTDLYKQAEATKQVFVLSDDLYQAGLTDYPEQLQAKERWLTALNSLVDSEQAIAVDIVAIYKAIGGHW